MGLNIDNEETNIGATPAGVKASVGNTVDNEVTDTIIGFNSRDLHVMHNNAGSEYTTNFAKTMMEVFAKQQGKNTVKVSVLDREVVKGLAYSAIVVSAITKKTVYYFTVLLEATGNSPMKSSEITNEIAASIKIPGQRPKIYTPDDAIDSILHDEILRAIKGEYTNVQVDKFISGEGVVIPTHHDDVVAANVASLSFNAVTIDAAVTIGDFKDLNITSAINQNPTHMLKLETNMMKQVVKNEVSRPSRQDFSVELNLIDTSNTTTSMNLQNTRNTLTKISGFIDSVPEEMLIQTMPGMPPVKNIRLHPNIILTSADAKTPTTGFMLMGIASSLVMTNTNMWTTSLMPKNKTEMNNVGALNIITNITNNQNQIGDILDLTSKSIKSEEAYGLLMQMYSMAPLVSYDVESYGTQTFYTSVLAMAAQPGNNTSKQAACDEIISSANWLTNGNFPADFKRDEIFAHAGVVVPLGTWADKSGERDIRDIDLAFIAKERGDTNMLFRWALSNMPKDASGSDPYATKVEIISNLIPDAEIHGKAIRVTFSTKFIDALISSVIAAGLDPKYDSVYTFTETNNLGAISNYLANAGVSTNSNFGRQSAGSVNGYSSGYSNMGQFRY